MKVAYLKILSFADSVAVPWAEHYYGTIVFDNNCKVSVMYKLDRTEAEKMNKEEIMLPSVAAYKPGEMTSRFDDKKRLIAEAIKLFESNSKGFDILIAGNSAIIDPQEILVGPHRLKTEANKLYDSFEKLNGWECEKDQETMVQEICDEWTRIMGNPHNIEL